jgi:hypothetical protein
MPDDMILTGGCLCGAVRYTIRPRILFHLYACHCNDCKRRSGSSFTLQQMVLNDDLEVTGEMAEGGSTNPSGARVRLYACPTCQSRIYGASEGRPTSVVRAGTLDDHQYLVPKVHVWTQSKQPWITIPEDAIQMETQPTDADGWLKLLMPS